MTSTNLRSTAAAIIFAAAFALATPSMAEMMNFKATMNGKSEVPANATAGTGMAMWRERLFVSMSKNAVKASDFFHVPTNRVVELGTQLEI